MDRNDHILYEILTPLDAVAAGTLELEPYVVYRNQIFIHTPRWSSPESTAPDYFSLDVDEVEHQRNSLRWKLAHRHCSRLTRPILALRVPCFGSTKVVILGSNISPQLGLQALSRELSQRGIAKKIHVIAKARVPIVKFIEKRSDVSFDVSFDVDNGPRAAEFIKDDVLKRPPLKPLCLILKVFLQQRELNEVYTSGIGSYALLSMLIAMLRNQHDHPEHNLGVLLMKFFYIYGCKLNTAYVGVSCNREAIFFPKSNKGFTVTGQPSFISIEDPQTPENDIGKNSFNYYQARSAFSMAFTMLTNVKAVL